MNIKDLKRGELPPKYVDKEQNIINKQWLYEVISNKEEFGLTGAVLSWENDERVIKDAYLEEASINIFSIPGTTVVQADFKPEKKTAFTHASNFCRDWINFEYNGKKEYLALYLMPLVFEGQLTIRFTNMFYYDSQFNGGNLRLIMVFDDNVSLINQNEEMDFEEMFIQAEREANRELKRIDEENFALVKEIEDLEKNHMFEEHLKEGMQDIYNPKEIIMEEKRKNEEKRESNPFKRISNDEDGQIESDEEGDI